MMSGDPAGLAWIQPALEQTRQLAEELGIKLPGLSDEQKKILRHFQKLYGEEFDEEFDIFMIEDHIQDIAKYEKAALKAKNPDLQAYARNSLPSLAEHLRIALEIGETVLGGDYDDVDVDD